MISFTSNNIGSGCAAILKALSLCRMIRCFKLLA